MIILDTNVVSALMQDEPEVAVVNWLDRQPRSSIWTTAITVYEIQVGIELRAPGKLRLRLLQEFEGFLDDIERRVADFDHPAALETARLVAVRQRKGGPRGERDSMIAGIALARHAALATRNTRHFDDLTVEVVDPWRRAVD